MLKRNVTPTSVRHTFPEEVILVSKTDVRGTIVYANTAFCTISGYAEEELIGQPHNIVRHPDMPRTIFRMLWQTIQKGEEFWGYVKNLAKDGGYYWVCAHVTPTFNSAGEIVGFHSDRRAPEESKLSKIEALYARLRDAEQRGGIEAGMRLINALLEQEEKRYDEYFFSL